MLLYWIVLV